MSYRDRKAARDARERVERDDAELEARRRKQRRREIVAEALSEMTGLTLQACLWTLQGK